MRTQGITPICRILRFGRFELSETPPGVLVINRQRLAQKRIEGPHAGRTRNLPERLVASGRCVRIFDVSQTGKRRQSPTPCSQPEGLVRVIEIGHKHCPADLSARFRRVQSTLGIAVG